MKLKATSKCLFVIASVSSFASQLFSNVRWKNWRGQNWHKQTNLESFANLHESPILIDENPKSIEHTLIGNNLARHVVALLLCCRTTREAKPNNQKSSIAHYDRTCLLTPPIAHSWPETSAIWLSHTETHVGPCAKCHTKRALVGCVSYVTWLSRNMRLQCEIPHHKCLLFGACLQHAANRTCILPNDIVRCV